MHRPYRRASISVLFLIFFVLGSSQALSKVDVEPSAISVYIENEERLFKIVKEFVDEQPFQNALTERDVKRFDRLLKNEKASDQKLMIRMLREMNGINDDSEPEYVMVDGVLRAIEDSVVALGRRFGDIEEDPSSFSIGDIQHMRGIREVANRRYRDGEYDEAFPILLGLAKRGFKDAQSRLAYILFTGTEKVEKSNLRALGWLGAAAHGRTEPGFRVLFNKYMREVPEHVRPTVDQVVSAYQAQYSHSEHLDCSIEHRYAKGVVKRTYCRFKLEAIADAQNGMRSWVDKVNVEE